MNSLKDLREYHEAYHYADDESQEGEKGEKGKRIFIEMLVKYSTVLWKKKYIQEAQLTPSRINSKDIHTSTHHSQT